MTSLAGSLARFGALGAALLALSACDLGPTTNPAPPPPASAPQTPDGRTT